MFDFVKFVGLSIDVGGGVFNWVTLAPLAA
jgi:hypothetical protein